MIEHLQL
jgi:hypothetical protein